MKLSPGKFDDPETPGGTPNDAGEVEVPAAADNGLPDRYLIREKDKVRFLKCPEAPTLSVRVERGYTVTAAAARKAQPGSIFLDGAATTEPFLDVEKQVFNLDHHEGCVRFFTLSTCEQAMVLVRKGINLRDRDWVVYSNEPDLDTVFAIWVLLNHIRLNDEDSEIRTKVMPLIRLQGAIDAQGLDMMELCGFPEDMRRYNFDLLEDLRRRELLLKKEGRWQEIDFLEYTADILRIIDSLIYSTEHFEGEVKAEELARAEIGERWLAIAVASETGIYRVEQHLRRLHGDRLGLIVLQKDPGTYTIRRADPSLPVPLERVYHRLNLMDPAGGGLRSGNRWGGSDEIGGSPRSMGTRLNPQEIVDICAQAYHKPGGWRAKRAYLRAFLAGGVILPAGIAALFVGGLPEGDLLATLGGFLDRRLEFALILAAATLSLLLIAARHGPRLYGLRLPSGFDWLILLPPALVAAVVGGARFPAALQPGQTALGREPWLEIVTALLFAASAEGLFRGLVHGILFRSLRIPRKRSAWAISRPVMISSLLYTFWACLPFMGPGWSMAAVPAGVLLIGICCGMAREKSESLLPPLLIHWAALFIPAAF